MKGISINAFGFDLNIEPSHYVDRFFTGTNRARVIEMALDVLPESLRAPLRKQLGPVVEGGGPDEFGWVAKVEAGTDPKVHAWVMIREVEVVS